MPLKTSYPTPSLLRKIEHLDSGIGVLRQVPRPYRRLDIPTATPTQLGCLTVPITQEYDTVGIPALRQPIEHFRRC